MKHIWLVLFLALEAAGSESFLLNIPLREDPSRFTAEVRVSLNLSEPPAGAQLVVAGTTTLALGQTATVSGDSITFEAGEGNQARIVYRVDSNFVTPGNFCNPAAGSSPKEVPMRFVGAQDVVTYRISSYAVGSPEFECSKAFKRVGDFPAFLVPSADGATPELTATNKGRDELDVILVLDKSGSMAGLPPEADEGATASKAAILRSAMTAFVAQWKALDAAGELGAEFPADRLGLVFFDSTAAPQTVSGGFFVPRGDGIPWDAVNSHVETLTPGGATTIGGGINSAFEQWQSDPDHDLALIIVTDGMQNTAPLIETIAGNVLTLAPVGDLSNELRKRFTPLYSIGFGLPAVVDLQLLQAIAVQTSGVAFIAVNEQTLFGNVGQTLVNFLKGNTISLALQRNATMTGAGPAPEETVTIDRSVPRMVVSVQWAPPRVGALDVDVIGPDGNRRAPATTSDTGQAKVYGFDLRPADAGTWRVRVTRAQSTATDAVPYTLNAFVVERSLETQLTLDSAPTATGDAIAIRARLAYDHKPLGKLPANAIRVRVQRPAEALGTILHDTRVDALPPAGADAMTPYQRKVAALTSRALVQRIYPRDAETIVLAEETPGLYTGSIGNTATPGLYAFEAVLDWDDPRTGRVHRVERLEKHVKVKPDPRATIVTTSTAGGRTLVAVTPRDRFGNYVGPGYESLVTATLNGPGTISSTPVDPGLTGTYAFTVTDLPAGERPDVDVTVDGVDVTVDGGVDGGGGTRGGGRWRVFIDSGKTITHGGRGAFRDGVFSINAGAERLLSRNLSVEAIVGYHRFENAIATPRMWQFSVGGKYWFGAAALRPFVDASAGAYVLQPAANTRFGASAGGGLLYQLTANVGLEGVYHFTVVNTEGDSVSFSTLQGGVRWSW